MCDREAAAYPVGKDRAGVNCTRINCVVRMMFRASDFGASGQGGSEVRRVRRY